MQNNRFESQRQRDSRQKFSRNGGRFSHRSNHPYQGQRRRPSRRLQRQFPMSVNDPRNSKGRQFNTQDFPTIPVDPARLLEDEIDNEIVEFCEKVRNASENGRVIFLVSENCDPYSIIQNSLMNDTQLNKVLNVIKTEEPNEYVLKINDEILVKGTYSNLKEAKLLSSVAALDKLNEHCFVLYNKKHSLEVDKDLSNASEVKSKLQDVEKTKPESNSQLSNSVAYRMMMSMGWKGGGLGAQEQGIETNISAVENISRSGLGQTDFKNSLTQLLTDYKHSRKLTSLCFNKDFTKEDRELIHKCGLQLGLKTKSYGQGENRYLTVNKKLSKLEIVKQCLRDGGENDFYKLTVPTTFKEEYLKMKQEWKVKRDSINNATASTSSR